jgi:GTP-binding protein
MFFDATQTISKVDKQLVEEISKHDKPCIFVVNKWDLAQKQDMTIEAWGEYLSKTFASMRHVPIGVLTAKDGRNIRQVVNLTQVIHKQAHQRMSTGKLNRVLKAAVENNPPPHRKNRRPKLYYGTQVAVAPPTIVIKCNETKLFTESWKRYLLGYLREATPFQEVPIRLIMRSHADDADGVEIGDLELHSTSQPITTDEPVTSPED